MYTLIDLIEKEVRAAFEEAGYEASFGRVTLSNRPDLCEYQCNGAMAAAKTYHKAPILIARDVVTRLENCAVLESAEAAAPGFINLKVSGSCLSSYLEDMRHSEKLGVEPAAKPKKIIIDYGGPNVAKPLHVGHLRSAVIGESIKRIARFLGHEVIGDAHLGDWGLQMGLVITEVRKRQPDLAYFQPDFQGEYPKDAPFTIGELEEIYPTASARSKADEAYRAEALEATRQLQNGNPGYRALWKHILQVSVEDLKKNYRNLQVEFDLWNGESDVQDRIAPMVQELKKQGLAYEDQGALVVDVKEETDVKEVPPCIILKSDGAALYTTTDLATIIDRMETYAPDEILYVVDKRQEMHFTQVFRCARKAGFVKEGTRLTFLGFGTVNGKDGKPFKTREGGVMRLESLIQDITGEMYKKIVDNRSVREEDAESTAKIVGLSAIKYGDLSNQAAKDYIFDTDRFTSFEGNTGPYILYTAVRIKSILSRYEQEGGSLETIRIDDPISESQKALMLEAAKFNSVAESAFLELAPHKICSYVYELANALNRFYHETKILGEEDPGRRDSFIALLTLVKEILETCADLLGFETPERM